jgi:hypothetical protein
MDLQAMARVWRDGQRKPCVVYRLLTTGCSLIARLLRAPTERLHSQPYNKTRACPNSSTLPCRHAG